MLWVLAEVMSVAARVSLLRLIPARVLHVMTNEIQITNAKMISKVDSHRSAAVIDTYDSWIGGKTIPFVISCDVVDSELGCNFRVPRELWAR